MDIAYPAREGRRRHDPLVYSLRTVYHHLSVDRVYIAGELPREIDPSKVVHIPTDQSADKFTNIGRNLMAVLESDISEQFIWMNDDFFFLTDHPDGFPLYDRGSMLAYCQQLNPTPEGEHNEFVSGMWGQYQIMRAWGHGEDVKATELHVPIPLDKTELKHTIDRMSTEFPDHPIGHFRAVYGAGKESTTIPDVKLKRADQMLVPGSPFISTSDAAWKGKAGDWIRALYWRKSPWEILE